MWVKFQPWEIPSPEKVLTKLYVFNNYIKTHARGEKDNPNQKPNQSSKENNKTPVSRVGWLEVANLKCLMLFRQWKKQRRKKKQYQVLPYFLASAGWLDRHNCAGNLPGSLVQQSPLCRWTAVLAVLIFWSEHLAITRTLVPTDDSHNPEQFLFSAF